jgi:4-amino-4-deoxy-L-arabinose transferase-like glycosyltransferase
LTWGYVDLAPLSALLLRVELALFGDSLFALRLFPALAAAGTVALTGALAQQLGGRAWAVTLACLGTLCAIVFLAIGNFYSLNAFEPLFWIGCAYCIVRLINGGRWTLWLWFGLFAGLGVENKHSMTFFGLGLLVALLLTPQRQELRRPGIWLGGLVALLLALPNIIWQILHDWPTYELLNNIAHSNKNVALSSPEFLFQQMLILNPATLPLWLGGLIWLLIGKEGRRYRLLGLAYLMTLAEFIILHGKHYYLAPVYPILFAAGGVALERRCAGRLRFVRPVFAGIMIISAAILAPTVIPILPPEKLVAYMHAIHFQLPKTETSHNAALPQLFADQFGWEELAGSVARAWQRLAPNEQKKVAVFCQNYGQAGAIDFFGRKYGLPPAVSGHQNYYLWGPRGYSGDLLLVIDHPGGEEPEQFRSVEDLGSVESSPWAMPWEQRNHIYLCRGLKMDLHEIWPELKEWL